MARIKVLLGKTGLDPNNKKIRALARGLEEVGGMEVKYTGLYRSMEEILEAALRGNVDVVGISTYTGSHMSVFPDLRKALDEKGGQGIILFGEGLVPLQDQTALKQNGTVGEIFSPAASTDSIINWINNAVAGRVNE